jgi:hypothetical protein
MTRNLWAEALRDGVGPDHRRRPPQRTPRRPGALADQTSLLPGTRQGS